MKLDLDSYVPGLLLWLSNKISSSASQLYLARFGIGVTDWRILSFFEIYPWATATRACSLMGLDKAAVSRSINFLVGLGCLKSRPSGLRKVEYAATASGRKMHDEIYQFAMEREDALLSGMSKKEREVLLGLLHRMLENLEKVAQVGHG